MVLAERQRLGGQARAEVDVRELIAHQARIVPTLLGMAQAEHAGLVGAPALVLAPDEAIAAAGELAAAGAVIAIVVVHVVALFVPRLLAVATARSRTGRFDTRHAAYFAAHHQTVRHQVGAAFAQLVVRT